jgi:hypothetical protein
VFFKLDADPTLSHFARVELNVEGDFEDRKKGTALIVGSRVVLNPLFTKGLNTAQKIQILGNELSNTGDLTRALKSASLTLPISLLKALPFLLDAPKASNELASTFSQAFYAHQLKQPGQAFTLTAMNNALQPFLTANGGGKDVISYFIAAYGTNYGSAYNQKSVMEETLKDMLGDKVNPEGFVKLEALIKERAALYPKAADPRRADNRNVPTLPKSKEELAALEVGNKAALDALLKEYP